MTRTALLAIAAAAATACVDGTATSTGPVNRQPEPSTMVPLRQPTADEYVIVLRRTSSDVARESQFAASIGGHVGATWHRALRGFAARLTPDQRALMARRSAVAFIEPASLVNASATQTCAPYTACSWGLDRIDETKLPMDGLFATPTRNGSNVHAYVIDTGIRITHREFGSRASYGIDIVDGDNIADDCNGHGTSMASLIGGRRLGVAKGVRPVAVRVLNCAGAGSTVDVISGIDWVTQHAAHPAVANLSLGGSPSLALDLAVQTSIQSGITYVVAAGGSASNACNFSPARVPEAITVGGTGDGGGVPPASPDTRTPSSNIGPCLDLFAPGASIRSAWSASDTAMFVTTGSSNSSAFVAGAAALYLDHFPNRTPGQVSAAIVANASIGVVGNPGAGSPNLLLNIGKPHKP
ncbi:MAG: Extracellular serine proteinase [Gemmatimonadaceae bacterium]|nr:Extracellular serine proteinase [Gemmatimonadaceae bacterium]